MFIANNHPSFHLWRKVFSLREKISRSYSRVTIIRRGETLPSNQAILSWLCLAVWIYHVTKAGVSYRHVSGCLECIFCLSYEDVLTI